MRRAHSTVFFCRLSTANANRGVSSTSRSRAIIGERRQQKQRDALLFGRRWQMDNDDDETRLLLDLRVAARLALALRCSAAIARPQRPDAPLDLLNKKKMKRARRQRCAFVAANYCNATRQPLAAATAASKLAPRTILCLRPAKFCCCAVLSCSFLRNRRRASAKLSNSSHKCKLQLDDRHLLRCLKKRARARVAADWHFLSSSSRPHALAFSSLKQEAPLAICLRLIGSSARARARKTSASIALLVVVVILAANSRSSTCFKHFIY